MMTNDAYVRLREVLLQRELFQRESRSVELRALCNDSPRTRQARKGATVTGQSRVPRSTRSSSDRYTWEPLKFYEL
jgi:hypothetical protein